MRDISNAKNEEGTLVFTMYITRNGKRIYRKNGRPFCFRIKKQFILSYGRYYGRYRPLSFKLLPFLLRFLCRIRAQHRFEDSVKFALGGFDIACSHPSFDFRGFSLMALWSDYFRCHISLLPMHSAKVIQIFHNCYIFSCYTGIQIHRHTVADVSCSHGNICPLSSV